MLHSKTVEPLTLAVLKELMGKPYLNSFILVGGTGLSLQIGHRISIDLDLFTLDPFDTTELKDKLSSDFKSFQTVFERPNTLISTVDSIKVDFIRFKYGFNYPLINQDNIRIADIKDIAPMKLDALSARGKRKDFYDLFFLLKIIPLPKLLELYQAKYNHTTIFHVIKSINYFVDAEKDDDPIVFDSDISWSTVKETIRDEVKKIL
jgi:predicted nucleotidyltransferase component of viral defense system